MSRETLIREIMRESGRDSPFGVGGGAQNLAAPVLPLISDRGAEVSHLWVAGGLVYDPFTRGINQRSGWAESGTVPRVAAAVPGGCDGRRTVEGLGPFGGGNFFSLGVGPDALDLLGDFSLAIIHLGTSVGSTDLINSQDTGATVGWRGPVGNTCFLRTNPGSVTVSAPNNPPLVDIVNVACVGRAGTTLFAKLNLGSLATTTGSTITIAPSDPAKLGAGAATSPVIYELWVSLQTPSDALFTAIQTEVKGRLGVTAW